MIRCLTHRRLLAVLLIVCLVSLPAHGQDQPYNVLLIAVDDLNDWVGPLGGYPGIKTPNIDRLARQGLSFSRAYCTAPSCNPSRTSLLTGLRPSTSGVYYNQQPWRPVLPEVVTLPEYFTKNGYEVFGAGKIFHIPFNDVSVWPRYVQLPKDVAPARKPVSAKANDSFDWGAMPQRDETFSDYKVVQAGIEFLKEKHDKPFFLAVGVYKPHLPWYVPRQYFDMYPLEKVQLPAVREDDLDDIPLQGVLMAKTREDHEFITEKNLWKQAVQAYCASITFTDAQVGLLLDALEKSEYTKNTVVILFSDHGWHLGEKKHWRKFTLWEESARVPFIVVAPAITRANMTCGRTVSLLDIYPTLLDLCRLPANKALEGQSLVPLLTNPTMEWDHPAVTTNGMGNHSLRSERWRYIQYHDGTEELYDHDADPNEWTNLAGDKQYAEVKRQLRSRLPRINAANAEFRDSD